METSSMKTRGGVTDEQPAATPVAERKGEVIPVAVAAQGCAAAALLPCRRPPAIRTS